MSRRRFSHSNNPGFDCSESVLLLPFGRRSYLPAILRSRGGEEIELDETTDRMVFSLRQVEVPTTLVYCGMGSPATANALEMIAANGGRQVVLFGACGGVDEGVGVGDLVVGTGAVRGEGTSRYYAPPGFPAACDPLLTSELIRRAGVVAGSAAHSGVVFTTDASYRQGPEIYQDHSGLIVGVECECAAAAVVAARLGLHLGALFFCTDNVALPQETDRSYRGLRDDRVRRGFDTALEVALATLAARVHDPRSPQGARIG